MLESLSNFREFFTEHPSVATGILGAFLSLLGIVAYVIRFRERRKIAGLRRRLQELGVTGAAEIEGFVRMMSAATKLPLEPMKAAFLNLVRNADVRCRHGTFGRLNRLWLRMWGFLFPYKLLAENEAVLKGYLDEIREYFATFPTLRRAGQPATEDNEIFVLRRLIAVTSYGEVWLAETCDDEAERHEFHFFTEPRKQAQMRAQQQQLKRKFPRLGNDPNLVQFYQFGFYRGKVPYLELEHVPGVSLKSWMLANAEQRVELDPAKIMHDVIRGIAAAHKSSMFHASIEPDKILLTQPFVPGKTVENVGAKVAEFCVAQIVGNADWHPLIGDSRARSDGDATREFNLIYTPSDEPPGESNKGPVSAMPKAQADVYAVGIIWYQLLVGQLEEPPYDFADRLREMKVDAPTIQRVLRCLSHPDRRFEDAQQLLADFSKSNIPAGMPPLKKPALPGHYDVSELLNDFIQFAESQHETYPPHHQAETAVRQRLAPPMPAQI